MITLFLVASIPLLLIPLTNLANASPQFDFAIPRYVVHDCIPPTGTSTECGTYLGQFGPDNLTGSTTKSTSVFIEIGPQYQNNGGTEVPITGILCSLDNAVPTPCQQIVSYTNLAVGQHFFKAILVTSFGNDPNPPVFTWKIIGTAPPPPPLTLGQQLTQNTWLQLCKNPTIFNSIQGRMHCVR